MSSSTELYDSAIKLALSAYNDACDHGREATSETVTGLATAVAIIYQKTAHEPDPEEFLAFMAAIYEAATKAEAMIVETKPLERDKYGKPN
jgi:hypothetical protein